MSHAPSVLAQAVGKNPQGQLAPNRPDDVGKVQALLRKVLGSVARPMQSSVCDLATQQAIVDFQQRWGGAADGVVDPGGRSLARLDRLATALELQPIALARVQTATRNGRQIDDGGGYRVAVRTCDGGPLPPAGSGYVLYLTIQHDNNTVDVTGRPLHDLMNLEKLGELLKVLDRSMLWGVPLRCTAQVRLRGEVITTSPAQFLNSPVRPHNGFLLPLDEASNGGKLSYQGDAVAKEFHGRMLAPVPGFSGLVFVYGGQLETLERNRGFDCITYAGTVCGAANTHMAKAEDLADSVGAVAVVATLPVTDPKTGKVAPRTVTLDQANPDDVKAFFAGASTGYFLMWSSGHIVVVADGEVHEFKASNPSGYARAGVASWLEPYKSKKLTVRKLPGKPARAT